MAFGWSFPKLMVFLSVAFLLVGVPILAWVAALQERRRRRAAERSARDPAAWSEERRPGVSTDGTPERKPERKA